MDAVPFAPDAEQVALFLKAAREQSARGLPKFVYQAPSGLLYITGLVPDYSAHRMVAAAEGGVLTHNTLGIDR